MPRVIRLLFVVGLGIAAAFSGRTASAALGGLGADNAPADSFWLDHPDFGHHSADWWTTNVPSGYTGRAGAGLANPFVPPPVRVFLEGNRGGFYATLLQTLRFGSMPLPGRSISMMSTPVLYAPDGEPILFSTQARWISSGPGQLVFLDPRFLQGWLGNAPGPQGGSGGPRVSSLGGFAGPGGIGGGGGGARRTASTTNGSGSNMGSNNDGGQTGGQTPIVLARVPQITTVDAPAPVPVPGAFLLFGSGLAALAYVGRKKTS